MDKYKTAWNIILAVISLLPTPLVYLVVKLWASGSTILADEAQITAIYWTIMFAILSFLFWKITFAVYPPKYFYLKHKKRKEERRSNI